MTNTNEGKDLKITYSRTDGKQRFYLIQRDVLANLLNRVKCGELSSKEILELWDKERGEYPRTMEIK